MSDRGEGRWWALLAIAGAFAAGWALVGPRADVPVIDDWVYAWSVQHLLATRRFQVLEISAFYPVAQILWGALFARVAGFSFGVLRASTVVLSVFGCWAVYLTLRELGCRWGTSLLGAMALALDPVYFALSFSFMTDVPFASLSAIALYCFVRAARRNQLSALVAGCAWAIAAFLIRPIGIVLPLAALPMCTWPRESRDLRWRSAASIAVTIGVMGALQAWMPSLLGPLQWAALRRDYLRWWFTVPAATYFRWNLEVLVVAAFPFAPLLLGYPVRWRRAIAVAIAAALLAIVCELGLGGLVMPLLPGQTWSLRDIAARSMLDGDVPATSWSARAVPGLRLLGLVTAASLGVIALRGWWRGEGQPDRRRAAFVIAALVVFQAICLNVLWLYNDRYYLVLAPALAIAAAWALDDDALSRWIAGGLLVLLAGIAVTGTRDMLAFNDACAREAQALEASGIPPSDIDAGYAWNGWRLYAHPENLPAGSNRTFDVPFVTSNRATRYSITNSPLPRSEVLRVVQLPSAWWQATRAVYVVRRSDVSTE